MSVDLTWNEEHSEDATTADAIVIGPLNRNDVYAEIVANIPLSYGALLFQRLESAKLVEGTVDVWNAKLRYAQFKEKSKLQVGDNEFRFGSASRTFTRTISVSSKVYDSSGEITPPDARIIGYNAQTLSADGAQDEEFINSFAWRVAVDAATVSESWRRSVGNLKNTLCNTTFFGYPSGEVVFRDITGTLKGDGVYIFNVDFLQSENPGEITIGGITVPDVEAWDTLDIDDQELVESDGVIVPKVRRVKVHSNKVKVSWSLLTSLLGMS